MALSYTTYPADGATKQFDVPFGYLRRNHVFVFVDGSMVAFSWISGTRIELDETPEDGASIRIQRLTDKINRITDFADGQTLLAGDLDAAHLQLFYLSQEMLDGLTDGVLQGDVVLSQPLISGTPLTIQQVQTLLDSAATNSPVIQELLTGTELNGSLIAAEATARAYAIAAEAATRADEIAAEAQARLDGITTEAAARAAAIAAEAQVRQGQLDGVQVQLDADAAGLAQTTADLAQTTADLAQEVQSRIDAVQAAFTALQQEVSDRQQDTADSAQALAAEVLARQTEDVALDGRLVAVVASVDDANALIAQEQTARIDGDAAAAAQLTVIQAASSNNAALIASEQTARTDADSSLASDILALTTRVGDNEASVFDLDEAITTESQARATSLAALQSDFDAASALIASNSTAISDEGEARASQFEVLSATFSEANRYNAMTQASASHYPVPQVANVHSVSNATISDGADHLLATASGTSELRLNYTAAYIPALADWTNFSTVRVDIELASSGGVDRQVSSAQWKGSSTGWSGDILPVGGSDVATLAEGDRVTLHFDLSSSSADTEAWGASGPFQFRVKFDGGVGVVWKVYRVQQVGGDAVSYETVQAAVTTEANARVSADAALSNSLSLLTARMTTSEASIIDTEEALATETTARVSALNALQAEVDANAAGIISTSDALVTETTARASALSALQAEVDANAASIVTTSDALVTETAARASAFGALQAEVDAAEVLIATESTARADGDSALATTIGTLTTRVDGAEAAITTNSTAVSDEAQARAASLSVIEASFEAADAAIIQEQETLATADEVLAQDLSGLTSRMGDAETAIIDAAQTSATDTEAVASELSAVTAQFSGAINTMEGAERRFTANVAGLAGDVSDLPGSWLTDTNSGPAVEPPTGPDGRILCLKELIKPVVGRTYKVVARWRMLGTLPTEDLSDLRLGFRALYGDTRLSKANRWDPVSNRTDTGWQTSEVEIYADTDAEFELWRPTFHALSSPGMQDYRRIVASFDVIDMTEAASALVGATALVSSEATARADADSALASDVSGLQTRIGDAEASIITTEDALSTETAARATAVAALQADIDNAAASIVSEQDARATADSALASDVSGLQTRVGTAEATIVATADALSTETTARATAVAALQSDIDGAAASIVSEQDARVATDSALSSSLSALQVEVDDNAAIIASEATARADADSALSSSLSALQVEVDDNAAVIASEATARADADSALSNSLAVLQAEVDDNAAVIASEATARADADGALSNSVAVLQAEAGANAAAIASEATARADGDSAVTQAVDAVSARTDAAEASITQVSGVAADALGRASAIYGLRQDVNGYISGFGLSNDGATADFAVLADTFTVARPGHGAPVGLFTVNGSGTVVMQNALIGGALIDELTVDKLTAGSLNADVILRGDLDLAEGRITTSNGVYMKVQGVAFGANNDLIDWYGPVMAITSCTKANAIMYADTSGNFHLGGGVTAEWASIQNVSVTTLDMASGAVGASTVMDTVATFDLYTGGNANPVNASEFNAWTDTLPEVPLSVGDQLVVDFSYDIECQFNAFEFYNFLDTVSVRYHFSNGTTLVAYPGDWVKTRFFACATNGAVPAISGAPNYDRLESFQRRLVLTVPDAAPFNTPGAVLEGVEVILSVEPYAQPGQSRAIHGGTYTGSKVTAHLKLRDINASVTVFADGPVAHV